jgi:NADH-quinone oxidoreductase subunit L
MLAADAAELTSGWFLENTWLIALVPVIGFAIIILFGKRLPMRGAEVGIGSMAISLVLALGALVQWVQRTDSAGGEEGATGLIHAIGRSVPRATEGEAQPFIEPVTTTWVWWQNAGLEFGIGSLANGLSVVLLALVAFITLLVLIYSIEYVRGDRRFTHFFAAMTLFAGGMLIMVMAPNMVQLILGWEIMGLTSFMLIGHWWEEQANSRAALKAFFTVRVGDVGLLVGTAIIFFGANGWAQDNLGSNGFDIMAIQAWALSGEANSTLLLWGAVALFIACIGKSGQFPLHTWLPDAMAGPTPVSSLLHSSTMVVAGVFLVAQLYPVFWEGFNIGTGGLSFIAIIGAITIIIAALLAFVQDDIKKVLAYSTVSQLGYMMLGLGTGAWLPAVFHIITHAFFKCALFLCAGSVAHSGSHHSFDMKRDMGGLRKFMPVTFWTWIISTLALTGVFPFAGFWSKDEIIDNVGANGYTFLQWVSLGGAALTAMYMTRATYLTFFGEPRGAAAGEHHDDDLHAEEHEMEHISVGAQPQSLGAAANAHSAADHGSDHHEAHHGPRESGKLLLVPILILTVGAVFAGFLNPTPLATRFGEGVELLKTYVEPRATPVSTDLVRASGPGEQVVVLSGTATAPAADAGDEGGKKSGCGFDAPEAGTACFFPAVSHAEPKFAKILLSLAIVGAAYAVAIAFNVAFYGRRDRRLVGLTERSRPLRAGYLFLKNRYYLDALYENVIVRAVAYPIAQAAYWVNQHVLDATVDTVGDGTRRTGLWVYRNLDQRVVDGAVNRSGWAASEAGHAMQSTQSGKVSMYGALLFGAAAVGAIVLVLVNVS